MKSRYLFTSAFFLGLSIICSFYIKSSGGIGVELPLNLLFLGIMGIALTICAVTLKYKINLRDDSSPLIWSGAALITLPWLCSVQHQYGVIILLLALLLWHVLRQISFTAERRKSLLWGILILGAVQASIGIIQTFFPAVAAHNYEFNWLHLHGRPYGIFQQVNLLGSFLATVVGCGLLLLIQTRNNLIRSIIIIALSEVTFVLALNMSRVGNLGMIIAVVALSIINFQKAKLPIIVTLIFLFASWCLGEWCISHVTILIDGIPQHIYRDYEGATHDRWYILTTTLRMIAEKPLLGWGYGSFEFAFSRYVLAHPELGYSYHGTVITHPHNELLFAWFQGGITALVGMLLLFAGWIRMIIRNAVQGKVPLSYTLLIFPLFAHVNLEYPFYQSFLHLALFVLLLRFGVNENLNAEGENMTVVQPWQKIAWGIIGIFLIGYSGAGLMANHRLTEVERNGLADFPSPSPWYFSTQNSRATFDGMVALLMDYNRTHDSHNLVLFMQNASVYSQHHNDKNVMLSMIAIENMQGHTKEAALLKKTYEKLFPVDRSLLLAE